MKTNAVLYVVAAVVIGVLLIANWGPLSSLTSVNLLFTKVEAPLAFLLFLCLGVVVLMNLGVHALDAHGWRVERRRLVSDLESARARAEREEESRTQALRVSTEREFAAIRERLDQLLAGQGTPFRREPPGEIVESAAPGTTFEPELIPPRPVPAHGRR